jgi:hypothetical protein
MQAPSMAALLVLASLICFDAAAASEKAHGFNQARYNDACPAYEHYARFLQYVMRALTTTRALTP